MDRPHAPQNGEGAGGEGADPHSGSKRERQEEGDELSPGSASKRAATGPPSTAECVFRMLVPERRVGSIIGKGGSVVRQMRDETGAHIKVVEGVPGCDERVVVISSKDDNGRDHTSAQVRARWLAGGTEKGMAAAAIQQQARGAAGGCRRRPFQACSAEQRIPSAPGTALGTAAPVVAGRRACEPPV